jgi:hypothetical protein
MCKWCPCWPAPQEAKILIEKGYAGKLMEDYWVRWTNDRYDPINIIGPAFVGYEKSTAPNWPQGAKDATCVFLENDLCQLHDKGLKPYEGRMANCQNKDKKLHEKVAMMWDGDEGREVVKEWRKIIWPQ